MSLTDLIKKTASKVAGNPAYTTEQWVQWLLRSARASASEEFKKEIRKRIDYYHGRQLPYLKEILDQQFKDPKSLKLQLQFTNIVRQIIDIISMVYKWGANRTLVRADGKEVPDKEQELWQYILETTKYDRVMKWVNKMVNLCGTVLVRPYYHERKGVLQLDVLTPDIVDVVQDPEDPTMALAVLYAKVPSQTYLGGASLPPDQQFRIVYHYWDAENYRRFLLDGTLLPIPGNEEGVNPFGVLPFVKFSVSMSAEGFFADTGYELTNAQDNINVKLTQLNNLIKLQTFSIPVLIGYDPKGGKEINIQPSKPIVIPPVLKDEANPDFRFVTPSPNIQVFLEEIDQEIIRLARIYGLSPSDFNLSGGVKSGFALKMENMKLLERRQNEVPFYEDAEEELFRIIKRVWNYYSDFLPAGHKFRGVKFSEETELKVTIPDPEFPEAPSERREEWDWKLQNRIARPVDYLMKYEHLSEDEAQERWEQIQKWWQEYGGGFGAKIEKAENPPSLESLLKIRKPAAEEEENEVEE